MAADVGYIVYHVVYALMVAVAAVLAGAGLLWRGRKDGFLSLPHKRDGGSAAVWCYYMACLCVVTFVIRVGDPLGKYGVLSRSLMWGVAMICFFALISALIQFFFSLLVILNPTAGLTPTQHRGNLALQVYWWFNFGVLTSLGVATVPLWIGFGYQLTVVVVLWVVVGVGAAVCGREARRRAENMTREFAQMASTQVMLGKLGRLERICYVIFLLDIPFLIVVVVWTVNTFTQRDGDANEGPINRDRPNYNDDGGSSSFDPADTGISDGARLTSYALITAQVLAVYIIFYVFPSPSWLLQGSARRLYSSKGLRDGSASGSVAGHGGGPGLSVKRASTTAASVAGADTVTNSLGDGDGGGGAGGSTTAGTSPGLAASPAAAADTTDIPLHALGSSAATFASPDNMA